MKQEFIQYLETKFKHDIRTHTILEKKEALTIPFPDDLDNKIISFLQGKGINSLYAHQIDAYKAIKNKQDTVIISRTAGGKTLSFLLPVIDDYLSSRSKFSTLLLYPTKALSRDQENGLSSLIMSSGVKKRPGTFDGDTSREERARLSKNGDFILSNPDMLHGGILPNHNRKWKNFLSRLKYIIVDEVHIYRGAFGSHVSNVFKRLLRICEIHGSSPIFICSSATIGNTPDFVSKLFHRNFTIIDRDGAPRSQRELYFINPPAYVAQGGAFERKGTMAVTAPLIAKAAKLDIRTICFCKTRQEVERLYQAVVERNPALRSKINPYRGGFLPSQRRELERNFFEGKTKVIISTNALELGIDIGDLELCLLSGHPGSIASFWQQSGRVGRNNDSSLIVFAAKNSSIDQYIVHHPEFLYESPVEEAWINPENPYIFLQHLPCAAYEYPLRETENLFKAEEYADSVEVLREDGTLKPYRDHLRYALEDYPSKGVNLRGMTDHNIEIICDGKVIGELDPLGARDCLYKDAIYQHLGVKYMSLDLDLDKKLCEVTPVNVDYYTESSWESRTELTETDDTFVINGHTVNFGYIHVNRQPKLYKKIKEGSFENVGYGPITLSPFEYDTTGFSLTPSEQWQKAVYDENPKFIGAALYGLSYMIKRIGPSFCMCDYSNIDTDVSLAQNPEEEWKSSIFLFDTIEGGVGYGEKIFEKLTELLTLGEQLLTECECSVGCPSCIPPIPPGVADESLEEFLVETNGSIACTQSLISHIRDGVLVIPQITEVKTPIIQVDDLIEEDVNRMKLQKRLKRASSILKKNRGRTH